MTQKELLYIEDAIGHECSMISILEDSISTLDDNKLISFMKKELNMHNTLKEKLMNVLEKKANE